MQSIINEPKPHFYQYMEIQLLQSYIQRGITYFITSISNSTDKLVFLRYHTDQIAFGLDFIKDFICLFKQNATYAEQFYGLQRKSLTEINSSKKFLKVLYHALINTLIPYFLNKIQKSYNNFLQQEQNQGRILTKSQKIFTKLYPYLFMILTVIQTLLKFKYLLVKQERVFDLYYKAAGTSLAYKKQRFQQGQEGKTHYPWMDLLKTPGLLAIMLGHKVLSWYFAQKNQRSYSVSSEQNNMSNANKYLSPLSALKSIRKDQIQLKNDGNKFQKKKKSQNSESVKGVCLICSKTIQNPTVIRQNGKVFCYGCITEYVRQNGCCPVTNIKLSQQNLQLVYSSA